MQPEITLGIVSHNRPTEVRDAIASADGHRFAEIVVVDSGSDPPLLEIDGVRLIRRDHNIGAAAGRNLVVEHVGTEVVLFLDDDAVLLPETVERVREAFAADARLGAVALHLVRDGGAEERIEQPFRRGFGIPDETAPCGYFITAGCAVRTEAYRAVGGSDGRMKYGTDDIDLGCRLYQAGWEIRWLRDARVLHRPSPHGRMASGELAGQHFRNRIIMARTFLPAPLAAVHLAAWALLTGRDALQARDLRTWWSWIRRGAGEDVVKRTMTFGQLRALHARGGRVLY